MGNEIMDTTDNMAAQLTLLKNVRALLSDKRAWCRYHRALDKIGRSVEPTSDEACQWCISGAFTKVGSDTGMAPRPSLVVAEILNAPFYKAWQFLSKDVDPIDVNDDKGYDAVLLLLDNSITEMEGLADA